VLQYYITCLIACLTKNLLLYQFISSSAEKSSLLQVYSFFFLSHEQNSLIIDQLVS